MLVRGSGLLPKGHYLWNISETKEARVYPKVVLVTKQAEPIKGLLTAVHSFV